MQPKTPKQVCDRLIRKGWNPSVVFYEGAKDCRNLSASLIRKSLPLLRAHRSAGKEIRALVKSVRSRARDKALEASWQAATDSLRALCRTSPKGTQRERDTLVKVAHNKEFVKSLIAAASSEPEIDPSWLAVFNAEGSPESLAFVQRQLPKYSDYPDLIAAIDSFKGAVLTGSNSKSTVKTHRLGSSVPTQGRGGAFTRVSFWTIIDRASITSDPAGTLSKWLSEMKPSRIAAFGRHFMATMERAYRFNLWGAAYLLLGGCSNDQFTDFRADLILRGKKVFELVLKNPDALADYSDIEGDETILSLLSEIYEAKTGLPLPSRRTMADKVPSGSRFNFDDKKKMRQHYPRISALKATGYGS